MKGFMCCTFVFGKETTDINLLHSLPLFSLLAPGTDSCVISQWNYNKLRALWKIDLNVK